MRTINLMKTSSIGDINILKIKQPLSSAIDILIEFSSLLKATRF